MSVWLTTKDTDGELAGAIRLEDVRHFYVHTVNGAGPSYVYAEREDGRAFILSDPCVHADEAREKLEGLLAFVIEQTAFVAEATPPPAAAEGPTPSAGLSTHIPLPR